MERIPQRTARNRVARRFGAQRVGRARAFTLIELLVVMGIMVLLLALLVPAFNSIRGGRDVTKAAYDIGGALEQARTFALANNTYAWVGFYEEDPSKPTGTQGTGRVVVAVVASKDGSRYSDAQVTALLPAAFGTGGASNQVQLEQLGPLIKLENTHMAAANTGASGNFPNRPQVSSANPAAAPYYQLGEPPGTAVDNANGAFAQRAVVAASGNITYTKNSTTFTYPLTQPGSNATPQYTFSKIIEFNAQGEASKIVENTFAGPGPQEVIEIALQPTHGSMVDPRYSIAGGSTNSTKAAAAVQVEGITGRVQIYKP